MLEQVVKLITVLASAEPTNLTLLILAVSVLTTSSISLMLVWSLTVKKE